jgi:hypothetical protein
MGWSLFAETSQEWENYLKEKKSHYRQSFYWGELKRKKNWKVLRLDYRNDHNLLETRVQILYKRFFFINFFFIPGGAIGDIRNLNLKFIQFLKEETSSKYIYIRLDDSSFHEQNINFYETTSIWQRPNFRMHNSTCAIYDFKSNISDFNKNYTRDFRSSVKSALKKNNIYKIEKKPDVVHLSEISQNMFKNKKIKMMDLEDFQNLIKYLNIYASFFVSYSNEGQPIAYRTILTIGDRSWDLAAATSYDGRKLFAGFGILNEIIKHLYFENVKYYDLGAILFKSSGINSFKLGTGARAINYAGEYEYSGSKFINFFTNLFIRISFSKIFQFFFFFRRLYF